MTKELEAEAQAAKEAKAVYDAHMERVRELLPVVRVQTGMSVVKLEELVGRVYDRGTISRLTSKAAGTTRKPGTHRRARKS